MEGARSPRGSAQKGLTASVDVMIRERAGETLADYRNKRGRVSHMSANVSHTLAHEGNPHRSEAVVVCQSLWVGIAVHDVCGSSRTRSADVTRRAPWLRSRHSTDCMLYPDAAWKERGRQGAQRKKG